MLRNTYTNIPYRYGGNSYDGADCFGVCWLYMVDTLGIQLPTYESFYMSNPSHDNYSARAAVRMLTKNGFRRTSELSPGCLLLGLSNGIAGFGLSLNDETLLTSCREVGSYLVSRRGWINSMDKITLFTAPGA